MQQNFGQKKTKKNGRVSRYTHVVVAIIIQHLSTKSAQQAAEGLRLS